MDGENVAAVFCFSSAPKCDAGKRHVLREHVSNAGNQDFLYILLRDGEHTASTIPLPFVREIERLLRAMWLFEL